ncbi:aminotransferase class V-fold PLP-dependent enzyme [Breznakiella homolactica]|uniref:cysteine desulfurase n=1 Tax=Breznakiella homolactica TaxID=2798577 RepID=A0A7T8BAG7_9SPIR|nr:aminotransferase class V-fold PLP-dependent enzyme [Breznakiella homolactica]QQO09497.1 aminotransferase class V-fold PLP-dependent enzyme [Breznakiella homolactica]
MSNRKAAGLQGRSPEYSPAYLNNAATTFPKPPGVIQAVADCLGSLPQENGRSNYETGETVQDQCRKNLGLLLGVSDHRRIFFTSGATEAANLVFRGLALQGRHIVITASEHNSVLRPLYNLYGEKHITMVPCGRDGLVSPGAVQAALRHDTACVVVNHCSNVTGAVQDIAAIGAIARRGGALFAVDAAQSAGAMPVQGDSCSADILIFTGHKALFGPAGTGGFFVREGVPLVPVKFGGTGTEPGNMAPSGPGAFEPGTPNIPGIAGLNAGASFILDLGLDEVRRLTGERFMRLREGLLNIKGLSLYGPPGDSGGIISFTVNGLSPSDVGYILQEGYNIAVRTGYHCAPYIMDHIGAPRGTIRASVSALTPEDHVDRLVAAVREIAYADN